MLSARRRVLTGVALGVAAMATLASPQPVTRPFCDPEPTRQGSSAFLEATGRKDSATEAVLSFVLLTARNERFTATPEIRTDLGQVADATTLGRELRVSIFLRSEGTLSGEVSLTGSISGDFEDDIDRCPYTRAFDVSIRDQTIEVQ
jgi:hypothetical protein